MNEDDINTFSSVLLKIIIKHLEEIKPTTKSQLIMAFDMLEFSICKMIKRNFRELYEKLENDYNEKQ